MNALIHYFSGTGNTEHMIGYIKDKLIEKGYHVTCHNIESSPVENLDVFKLQIFAYPIYGFGTPSIMLKYLNTLKPIRNCKACVICTSAGFEGESLVHVKNILSSKGYDVFLIDNCVYPHNWTQIINPVDDKAQEKILNNVINHLSSLCTKIINYEISFKKPNLFNLLWSYLAFISFSLIWRRLLGKTFIADSSCNSCKKCINLCPVKSIQITNDKPTWDWNCENCQRCINQCPSKSIQTSLLRLLVFVAIEISMIFVVINFNSHYDYNIFVNIVVYCILSLLTIFISSYIMDFLQNIPSLRIIFEYSFTKRYRQYSLKTNKTNKK